MNSKRTNRLVAILNMILVLLINILSSSKTYLYSKMLFDGSVLNSSFNSLIVDIFVNSIIIILYALSILLVIFNIICAFQNRKNKKVCFWQLILVIYEIAIILTDSIHRYHYFIKDEYDIKRFLSFAKLVIYAIIPIILAMINIALIKKNKPKVIQVISYIIVILFSVLWLLKIIDFHLNWDIIIVIMQLIYIHYQDKNIVESKKRKIINIILYYIMMLIFAVSLLIIISYCLITVKLNDIDDELYELCDNITTLQGSTIEDLYIPVQKNYKYGFIDDKGQEKISCEYDSVSFFYELSLNDNLYYVSFAKKDNELYIISKTGNRININYKLKKYIQDYEKWITSEIDEKFEVFGNVAKWEIIFMRLFNQIDEIAISNELENNNEINLNKENSLLSYNSEKYSLVIEPIYEENDEENEFMSSFYKKRKYNITVTKQNGEKLSIIGYLPKLSKFNYVLDPFTNGYIEFESENNEQNGWFDNDGNIITISDYPNLKDKILFENIVDMKDDKIILKETDDESIKDNYTIVDLTGKTLLESNAIDIYDNLYLVKNKNNKMELLDNNLNVISDEYERIVTNWDIDSDFNFSSYPPSMYRFRLLEQDI